MGMKRTLVMGLVALLPAASLAAQTQAGGLPPKKGSPTPPSHVSGPPATEVNVMPGYPNVPHTSPDERRQVRPGTTLILWGNRDDIIPVEHAYAAADRIAGSRLEIFEGAGHFLHVEEPARFAEALVNFVEATEPAQRDPLSFRNLLATGTAAVS